MVLRRGACLGQCLPKAAQIVFVVRDRGDSAGPVELRRWAMCKVMHRSKGWAVCSANRAYEPTPPHHAQGARCVARTNL